VFWSIFFQSAAAILIILLVGSGIAKGVGKVGERSEVDRDG